MTELENREAWLMGAVQAVGELMESKSTDKLKISIPSVRISVGFPSGWSTRSNAIGQCWESVASTDGRPQIFVHPKLVDVSHILAVIAHELIHAADDCQSGHTGAFRKMAKAIGLAKPLTESEAGEELAKELGAIAEQLGAYPHAGFDPGAGDQGEKKQSTRMLKLVCPEAECEGYLVRTTKKWVERGLPRCPEGHEMELEES